MDIGHAIAELRAQNEPVPKPLRLPTEAEVEQAEREIGVPFPADYRRYLLEASDVVLGTKEPCVVTLPGSYIDLAKVTREAWDLGVPQDWLPFCEDNGDYFCLVGDLVRYWSHNGSSNEQWPDLGTWIEQVWIGGG